MRALLFFSIIVMLPLYLMAQTPDCKFEIYKDPSGQIFEYITVKSKIGKLLIGRNQGKIVGSYTVRDMVEILTDRENMTKLRIDSVSFLLENNAMIKLKAVGTGAIRNFNNKLTYTLQKADFSFMVENPQDLKSFREHKVKGFLLRAEKEARFGDLYDENQRNKLQQAFTCLQ